MILSWKMMVAFRVSRVRPGGGVKDSIHFNLYTMAQDYGSKRHTSRCYGDRADFYGVYCPDNEKTYLVPNLGLAKAVGVAG